MTLVAVSAFGLLSIGIMAGISIWSVWHDFESYRRAQQGPGIYAEVMSIEIRKLTLWGVIGFHLPKEKSDSECIANVALGSGSEYLKFKPGSKIEVIPRLGCDDPVVVSNAKLPIAGIILSLFYVLIGCVAMKGLHSAVRKRTN